MARFEFGQDAVVTDTAVALGLVSLKDAALFFDRVIVLETPELAELPRVEIDAYPGSLLPGERDLLVSKRFVEFRPWSLPTTLKGLGPAQHRLLKWLRSNAPSCNLLLSGSKESRRMIAAAIATARTRAYAAAVTSTGSRPCIPACVVDADVLQQDYWVSVFGVQSQVPIATVHGALEVLIQSVPLPSPTCSWDEIFLWRAQGYTQTAFRAFRQWLRAAAADSADRLHLEDQFIIELQKFSADAAGQSRESRIVSFNAILIAASEIGAALVAGNFGTAINSFVKITQRKAELLSAEEALAMRGPYYLWKARQVLST